MVSEGDRPRVPSGTTLRFASLVLLAAATTLQIFGQYGASWPVTTSLDDARCQVRSGLYFTSSLAVDPDESKWDAYRACMAPFLVPRGLWLLGGLVLLTSAALLIYFLRPRWRIFRRGLVPVPEELHETLAALVEEAGLTKAPVFLLEPTKMHMGGTAFGNHRRKYVSLNAAMLVVHREQPETFRAIVLHELAHVRADVTVTYATLAIWRAFVVVVLTPYVLTLINPMLLSRTPWKPFVLPPGYITFSIAWRLAVMVLLVFLARIAVLRAREKYADVLVVRWTGDQDPYRVLPARSWFRRWFGHHPAPAARSTAMRDPDSLLRPGFWEVLACALAVQIAWWHTTSALRNLSWYHSGNESFLVMRIVWVVPMAALIGLVAWRGAAGVVRCGTFLVPGLAIGTGLVLGDQLDMYGFGFDKVSVQSVLASAALTGTAVLVTVWAGYCATLVRTRRQAWLLGLSIPLVVFPLLAWFAEIRAVEAMWRNNITPVFELLAGYTSSNVDAVALQAVSFPFLLNFNRTVTVVALALVWLVPLLLRRELPRGAVIAGAAGGVLAAVAVVLLGNISPPLVATAWQIVAVVAVELVVVLAAARHVDRVGALLATWLTGLVATVAIWLTHLDGTQVDSVLASRPLQVLPVLGTLAALLGGFAHVSRPRHPSRPWFAVAAAVLGVGMVAWQPGATDASASMQPPVPTSTELNTDDAVNTWIYGGGWDRMMTVVHATNQVFVGVKATDPAGILQGCENLVPALREEFPDPPDAVIAENWRTALADLETAARSCVAVYRDGRTDDGSTWTAFSSGLGQLGKVQTGLTEAQERALS
ncbi:M48 family metalloprotease [Lentzea sp. CA-135723]|uniref:M48 family metalloprotease n=1 Tax=Lentzea sp. CA-135723 TaxID=3239950 RepID=UPI003D8D1FA7